MNWHIYSDEITYQNIKNQTMEKLVKMIFKLSKSTSAIKSDQLARFFFVSAVYALFASPSLERPTTPGQFFFFFLGHLSIIDRTF